MKTRVSILAVILFPIVLFYGIFFYYAIDMPINDDYNAILEFVNKYIAANSIQEKMKLIFSQHNEHRIVFDRLCSLAYYTSFKKINFIILALIGNLTLVGVWFVWSKKVLEFSNNILLLFPISVIVFSIHQWENMNFAMATLQNSTAILFAILCLHFITKQQVSKSLIFLFCAIYTSGSGIFIIPIGFLYFFQVKNYKFLFTWGVCALVFVFLYFIDYATPAHHSSGIPTLMQNPFKLFLFAFSFIGNSFSTGSLEVNEFIGFLFVLYFLYLVRLKYYNKNPFVFYVMLYVILLAFVTGINRFHIDMWMSAASRYRINSLMFLAAIYISILDRYTLNIKVVKSSIIVFAFYFLFYTAKEFKVFKVRYDAVVFGIREYKLGYCDKLFGFEPNMMSRILKESEETGIFKTPNLVD